LRFEYAEGFFICQCEEKHKKPFILE